MDTEAAIVGAGVVGCATALALARRGASVVVLEAEDAPALAASGTNSGIVHTGFDSPPGELETELILRAGELRETVFANLGIPLVRCGALVRPANTSDRSAIAELAVNATRNGVETFTGDDGVLEVPAEAITDPVAYTLALAGAAVELGAVLRTRSSVTRVEVDGHGLALHGPAERVSCRVAINCAGLQADEVARLAGDDSFEIYPRKGEFLVFDPPPGERLERILLPIPTKRTKGVLVFPTLDGKVVAGPTAVDQEDKDDWTVRSKARDEILPKAMAMYPPLEHAQQIAAYAGLRPAGRGVNYVIGQSKSCPRLVNAAAIRSTGLTASLAIAERICRVVAGLGVGLGPERPLDPASHKDADPIATTVDAPWWRRVATYRAQ